MRYSSAFGESYLTQGADAVPYEREHFEKELDSYADHSLWYHVIDAAAKAVRVLTEIFSYEIARRR